MNPEHDPWTTAEDDAVRHAAARNRIPGSRRGHLRALVDVLDRTYPAIAIRASRLRAATYRQWTAQEDAAVREFIEHGRHVAAKLGRSDGALFKRVSQLRYPKRGCHEALR